MNAKVVIRRNDIDWLRVLAIFFVFIYHSTRFFNMETWMVKNPIWYPWVEIWNIFAAEWMMPLIFVISGASLFFAVGKGGTIKFIKDKVLRLLVPFIAGVFTHISLQVYLDRLTHGQFKGSYFQFLPQYFFNEFDLEGKHLWYLLILFVFSLILYPLLRWMKGKGLRVLTSIGDVLALPGAVYALALPTLLMLMFINPDNPVIDFRLAGWQPLIYLWLLLSGFLVFSSDPLQARIKQVRWLSLSISMITMVAYLYECNLGWPNFSASRYPLVLALRGFCSWCCILTVLGFGMQHLTFSSPVLNYANEAVLPFYILHQTVLFSVGYFVVQWAIADWLKWPIIVLVSFAAIMLIYEFLVRRINPMRFLFGMKLLVKSPVVHIQKTPLTVSK
jgi:glucans biosynthesis protein C